MHIPDGYLSPSTCAAFYASACPFWYAALNQVKRQLHTRFVPLVSVFSAFSFVIMMFNLPLPGGTTGHATGVGLATVVLGPWAAMLAISIALLIQAVFFGDGGILTFGANCFNIAIMGSLAAAAVYRLIGGSAAPGSSRRVIAAGMSGYVAINLAALLTAVQFGMQPMLFHDAAGTPLYAPYSLSVAVPAMMLGHLTLAGLAEFMVSAGMVAYLQRREPALLSYAMPTQTEPAGWDRRSARRLWLGLAMLMILTPLGLLTVGSAWGEWSAEDFRTEDVRTRMTTSSNGVRPPASPPTGLERLATFWTAPMPDYAPPLMKNPAFGYILSAMAGSGLILLVYLGLSWAAGRRHA